MYLSCHRVTQRHSWSYFLLLYWSTSSYQCSLFDSVSSNFDKALSMYSTVKILIFGGINVHHRNWLTYSGRTGRPGELCYNFWLCYNSVINLECWLPHLHTWLWYTQSSVSDLFVTSGSELCSAKVSHPMGNSNHLVVSPSIGILLTLLRDAMFHYADSNYSWADWDGFHIWCFTCCFQMIWEDSRWNLWYIPNQEYKIKAHTSMWFTPARTLATTHRNNFFLMLIELKW